MLTPPRGSVPWGTRNKAPAEWGTKVSVFGSSLIFDIKPNRSHNSRETFELLGFFHMLYS
jgi:hypothetical protein